MVLAIVYLIIDFFESAFCYLMYKNNVSKEYNLKKMFPFCGIYLSLLSLFKYLTLNHSIFRFASVVLIFVYFLIEKRIENKKNNSKNWICILTFSIFIGLLAECSQFSGYIINRYFWQWSGAYSSTKTTNLLLYKFSFLVLHVSIMYVIYKFRFIKIRDIKNLSVHKQIPIIFGMCLSTIIYIKHHYNMMGSDPRRSVFMWIMMFLLPTYLSFYWNMCKITRLKNVDKNHIIDGLLEYMVNIPMYCSVLNISPNVGAYLIERVNFKRKLEKLGINHGFKGYSELVTCLSIVKHNEGLKPGHILSKASRLTKEKPEAIYENISNIIKKTWLFRRA